MAIRGKMYMKNANGTFFFDIFDRHASGDNALKMRLFFNVSDKYQVMKKQSLCTCYQMSGLSVLWREFCVPDAYKGIRMFDPEK